MAIYRNIALTFWEDIKIVDDFTPEDRYFYLYLLTNPHTNLLGCYQLSFRQMVNETGYNKDTIENLIKRMENVHKVIIFDKQTNEIYIKNWHKYNWTKSEKLLKSVEKLITTIKSKFLKLQLQEKFKKYTVSIGYQYSMDTTVSVSVSVSDSVSVSEIDNNIINLYEFIEENYNRTLSSVEIDTIEKWEKEFGKEIIKHAVEISILNRKQSFSYVEGILKNWKSKGYKTLEEIKQEKQIEKKEEIHYDEAGFKIVNGKRCL